MPQTSTSGPSGYMTATDLNEDSWEPVWAESRVYSTSSINSDSVHRYPPPPASAVPPRSARPLRRHETQVQIGPQSISAGPLKQPPRRSQTLSNITPHKHVEPSSQYSEHHASITAPVTPSSARSKRRPGPMRVVIVSSDEEDDSEDRTSPLFTPVSVSSSMTSIHSIPSQHSGSSGSTVKPQTPITKRPSFETTSPPDISVSSIPQQAQNVHANSTSKDPSGSRPVAIPDVFGMPLSNVTMRRLQRDNKPANPPTIPKPETSRTPVVPPVLPVSQPSEQSGAPPSVLKFSTSNFGVKLSEHIIAHCHDTQQLLDEHEISWGTQFELARGVSNGLWTWASVRDRIPELKGTNLESAYKVERIMTNKPVSTSPLDANLWAQLDREQLAIKEGKERGLGLMGEFEGVPDWYGGKIQQLAKLVLGPDGSLRIVLERMESRRSHRFARFYGSRRFIQLRVSKDLLQQKVERVKAFLLQKFVVCGRIFVPFHSKERNTYLVETNENYERLSQDWAADDRRMSFKQFINWHNPLSERKNCNQVISKWATRFALGLSNSVPALIFEEPNIIFIEDITAEGWPAGKKGAPADKLMTDGCGFMNRAALSKIMQVNHFSSIPAGVQGRIDGSKGFFILHPTDVSTEPKIWIRDSQNKIKNAGFDRAHRIFDLLCASQPSPSAALTPQITINLHANGVPATLLAEMMEEGLEEEIAPLLEWDKPHGMELLYESIAKAGGVASSRTQRVVASLNRVLGFKGRDWHDDDGEEDDNVVSADGLKYVSSSAGRNEFSGAPLSLHETAMELIQAGFHPGQCQFLHKRISYIVQQAIAATTEKGRIPVAKSVGAFIVPDPLGVLEEGEVSYRFSKPKTDPETGLLVHGLEGDILVGRYPIRLPSDVQKVRAVYRHELEKWPDVLIISTKGKRSIASLLADGDMDGDEIVALFDKKLVDVFESQPFTNPPRNFMEDNFNRDVVMVEQFCEQAATLTPRKAQEAFQAVLINNLSESQVGMYSKMHENALVKYGYTNNQTIRLAYIFATLLDSSKSGRRLKKGLFGLDKQKYIQNFSPFSVAVNADILAYLKKAGMIKGEELMGRYHQLTAAANIVTDPALARPYTHFNSIAMAHQGDFYDQLQQIRNHVKGVHAEYSQVWGRFHEDRESSQKKKRKSKSDDMFLEVARKFATPIPNLDLIENQELVKAAYAYEIGNNSKLFAFTIAFRSMCLLKSMSTTELGGIAPSLRAFDEGRSFSLAHVRALKRAETA